MTRFSATVKSGSRLSNCGTTPTRARASRAWAGTGIPASSMVPLSGEVFELEEMLRQAYAGFAQGRAVMPAERARASVAWALAAERAWHLGRSVAPDATRS